MIDLISVDNMRASDQATISSGVPGIVLMERAARGIFLAADKWMSARSVCIIAGSGNNGGDGFALALVLAERDIPVKIYTLSDKTSADASYYRDKCIAAGIGISHFSGSFTPDCDIIVDCLLGTGFHGQPRDEYAHAITVINDLHDKGCYVISADINSGMNGDTGEYVCCVRSDLTVSIGFLKKGQISPDAMTVTGRIAVAGIGIDLAAEEDKADESQLGILCLKVPY